MNIFENISKLAKERNITIGQLEHDAGLGNATIRAWNKANPNISSLKKVSEVLGVTIEELIKE